MEKGQKWYCSRTLWYSVAQALAGAVLWLIYNDPEVGALLGGNAILVAFLRYLTTKPLKF